MTNVNNLPLPIAVWLANNEYEKEGDEKTISATTLLKSVRQIILSKRYKPKEVDVADMISIRIGTAIHKSIEESLKPVLFEKIAKETFGVKPKKLLSEIRTKKEINGFTISGQFDIVYNKTIIDVKTTSVWKYLLDSKDEYIRQMSIYKWLNPDIIKNDIGYICFVFTDWSKSRAKIEPQYPQQRIIVKEFLLDENIEEWIYNKTRALQASWHLPDDELPYCTPEERWEKPTVWKYYKSSSKKAFKVYSDKDEALKKAEQEGGLIVESKGESIGCEYCMYSHVCNQYKIIKEETI